MRPSHAIRTTTALCVGVLAFGVSADAATTVRVTAGAPEELQFRLSRRTAGPGTVTFRVTNRGNLSHDFRIAGRKTRLLAPGARATLRVRLSRGRHRYICTVPGHADGGMRGTLRVR